MTVDDPRPLFARALEQMGGQVHAVLPVELTLGTPCSDYDVRTLLGHIVAVLDKVAQAGREGEVSGLPDVVVSPGDDWVGSFTTARTDVERVWADDPVLDRTLTLPWARMPGREVLAAYTHELTVHAWDLATATGRAATLDPDLGEHALAWFEAAMPAGSRDDQGRFGAAVAVPDDADVYTRLAAHTGRQA